MNKKEMKKNENKGFVRSGITLEQVVSVADCALRLHVWCNAADEDFTIIMEDPRGTCLLDDETLKKEVRKMSTYPFSGLEIWAGNWSDEDYEEEKEEEDDGFIL